MDDRIDRITAEGDRILEDLNRQSAEAFLQAAIELMSRTHTAAEIREQLRAWADYFEAVP